MKEIFKKTIWFPKKEYYPYGYIRCSICLSDIVIFYRFDIYNRKYCIEKLLLMTLAFCIMYAVASKQK